MDNIRKALLVCSHNFRKWIINPRFYIVVILLIIFSNLFLSPISQFADSVGYRTTPYLLPFITGDILGQALLMFGIVLLFCDAPFIDEGQPYILLRAGRKIWAWGQVLYIVLASAVYFLMTVLFSVLMLLPHVVWIGDWGKVLYTLAQSSGGRTFGTISISYELLVEYTPWKAMAVSFLLSWLGAIFLGLLMFLANTYFKRAIGAVAAVVIIIFDFGVVSGFPNVFRKISPITLSRLRDLDLKGIAQNQIPSLRYAFLFFTVSIVVLATLSVVSYRKRPVEVLPPL